MVRRQKFLVEPKKLKMLEFFSDFYYQFFGCCIRKIEKKSKQKIILEKFFFMFFSFTKKFWRVNILGNHDLHVQSTGLFLLISFLSTFHI